MSNSYQDSLLATGETIQRRVRQHWITLVRAVAVSALVMAAAVAGLVWARGDAAGNVAAAPATPGTAQLVVTWIAWLFLLWAIASLALALARWWTKVYVVTTRRVIEINGLLAKTVTDSNLDKVNDVILRQSALGRVLDYGDIEIITGSDIGLNRFEWLQDPLGFKRVMLDNKEDFDSISRASAGGTLGPSDIPAAIEQLGQLRDRNLISPEEFERKKAELLSRF